MPMLFDKQAFFSITDRAGKNDVPFCGHGQAVRQADGQTSAEVAPAECSLHGRTVIMHAMPF